MMYLRYSVFKEQHRLSCTALASPSPVLLQKKQTAADYMAGSGKIGNEEKWGQAAMEYMYEKNHLNDSKKWQRNVDRERGLAKAYDRFQAVNEAAFSKRLTKLLDRMSEALEAIRELDLEDCLDEAVLLNTEQLPQLYRRPTLSPPLLGYEPGFGLDVPQLKSQQAEYPPVHRPTDSVEFSETEENNRTAASYDDEDTAVVFPYVNTYKVEDITRSAMDRLEEQHGIIREASPLTGVEGEAWEAYVALQRKALARQQLILDLCSDTALRKEYDADATYRSRVLKERGLVPLEVESEVPRDAPEPHFAQAPAYHPFRKS